MRTASTPERQYELKTQLIAPNAKSVTVIDWLNDDGVTWELLEDFDSEAGVSFDMQIRRDDYSNFGLTPLAGDVGFQVVNFLGRYSEGSNTQYEGILKPDRKIRVRTGYFFKTPVADQTSVLSMGMAYKYFTKLDAGVIVPDMTNQFTNQNIHFKDLFLPKYGAINYGTGTYGSNGYAVFTFDGLSNGLYNFKSFDFQANTTRAKLYYRNFGSKITEEIIHQNSTNWIAAGATINGTKTVSFSPLTKRFFQVAVVFDGNDWGPEDAIIAADLTYDARVEFIYKSVYLLDSTRYPEPQSPEIPRVVCAGRDNYKRAIENESNLPNISGQQLDQVAKFVADSVRIPYSATSVAALSAFGPRALASGFDKIPKGEDIFRQIMDVVNQEGLTKYKLYTQYDDVVEDNLMFIQPRADDYNANFVFNSKYYNSIGDRSSSYDKIINRFSVDDGTTDTGAEVLLQTQTITTPGTYVFSWSGQHVKKRFTKANVTGSPVGVVTDVQDTSVTIDVSAVGAFSFDVSVYGSPTTTVPAYYGEWINFENSVIGRGQSKSIENHLIVSTAEAIAIAKGFLVEYGNPVRTATDLSFPYLNVTVDPNDMTLLLARFLFDDHLYRVTTAKHTWNYIEGKSVFTLEDSGKRFSDISNFEYDEAVFYDIGFVYDMRFGRLVSDAYIAANTPVVYDIPVT